MQENVVHLPVDGQGQKPKSLSNTKKMKKPMQPEKRKCLVIVLILCVLSLAVWAVSTFVIGGERPSMGDAVAGEIFPETIFTIAMFGLSYEVSSSVFSVWVTFGILVVFAVIFRLFIFPKFTTVPNGFQTFVEWIIGCFDSMARESVHKMAPVLGPIAFGTAAFICTGTLAEMTGLIRPPNADINVCIALAIITFALIHLCGVIKKGVGGRLKRYVTVIPLLTDIAVPVSMTFRLYGSILSGFLMNALIYSVLSPIVPAFCFVLFTLFHALIQSYVFAVLTLSFVGEAIE